MFRSAISQTEKLALVSDLSVMIAAGIPILEAVESLLEDAKGATREFLLVLEQDLKQGMSLSATFAKFPQSFDPVFISLIKAGESSGTLEVTLKNLTVAIKKEIEFSEKFKAALAYPLLVLLIFAAVLIIILTFVVPKIAQVFSRIEVDLPPPTKILIATSDWLIEFAPLVIIAFCLIAIALYGFYRVNKRFFLRLVFWLPFVSQLGKYLDLARFSGSLFLLLSSGIPIVESLNLSRQVILNKRLAKALKKAEQAVIEGERLAIGLKQEKKIVPALMIRLIDAGERSGSLDKSMAEINEYYVNQAANSLKIITQLIEPILLVIIGLVVGGTLLAIVAPIYQLIGQIKAR